MSQTRCHLLCTSAERVALNSSLGGVGLGPDSFSVPLCLSSDPTTVTHYAGSGLFEPGVIAAIHAALTAPHYCEDGTTFDAWISAKELARYSQPRSAI